MSCDVAKHVLIIMMALNKTEKSTQNIINIIILAVRYVLSK